MLVVFVNHASLVWTLHQVPWESQASRMSPSDFLRVQVNLFHAYMRGNMVERRLCQRLLCKQKFFHYSSSFFKLSVCSCPLTMISPSPTACFKKLFLISRTNFLLSSWTLPKKPDFSGRQFNLNLISVGALTRRFVKQFDRELLLNVILE